MLLDHGRIEARVVVPVFALFLSIPLLALGIWTTNVWIGLAALTAGAGSLAAALAPIDAARLDIVHPRMWGRGEAGRDARGLVAHAQSRSTDRHAVRLPVGLAPALGEPLEEPLALDVHPHGRANEIDPRADVAAPALLEARFRGRRGGRRRAFVR